ncbi:hypothetical protein Pan241w_40520 [Gimesia alba]|uniref:Uncharacterized protein n=1 Tax=Gimesia alba TaxID=2527973 RepID=A0A517RJ97_9PLAN|nr:hypothetical protein Pan241w_40520 [Gimesia alba]
MKNANFCDFQLPGKIRGFFLCFQDFLTPIDFGFRSPNRETGLLHVDFHNLNSYLEYVRRTRIVRLLSRTRPT